MGLRALLSRYLMRSTRFPWVRPRSGRFLTVRMDTTNRCNLRCRMCPMRLSDRDPDRKWTEMSPGLWRKLVAEVFPLARTVGLSCGAEPFMNPALEDHLADLRRADVPVRELVTNGTLLDGGAVDMLLRHPPTSLFVSVDGARPQTHARIRGGADLERTKEGIRMLVAGRDARRRRFPMVSLSVTLQDLNLGELPDIVDMAADLGAVSVGAELLVPYEGLDMAGATVETEDPRYAEALSEARLRASDRGIVLNAPATGAEGPGAEGCRYVGSWVYIDPDGLVNPCPYWNLAEPLGDLSACGFDEVWRGEAYEALRERLARGVMEGSCAGCPELSQGAREEVRKV